MATHKSAEKRARQSQVKRLRNRQNESTMKTAMNKVLEAIEKKDFSEIDALFKAAQSVIAKTKRKGVIHVNNMARRISRLAKAINKARASVTGK